MSHERLPSAPRPNWVIQAVATLLLIGGLVTVAFAADDEKTAPPESVSLRTRDGVALATTFYASDKGKEAVPIILLHGSKGTRDDFSALAVVLQKAGHAVIAPDLRGHGHSTRPDRAADLRTADYVAMVAPGGDLETVKSFLMQKNNAGELNIDKLCVVGVETGAVVAINWAMLDWSWPELTTGKQGQDVKALVLVSPEWAAKGLRINEALADANVRTRLSVLIVAGKAGNKAFQDARRLYNSLLRYHPQPTGDEAAEKQTLWLKTPNTSLQGAALLGERSMKIDQMIARFIEVRLTNEPIPWSERKNPLQ